MTTNSILGGNTQKNKNSSRNHNGNNRRNIVIGGAAGLLAWQALSIINPTDNLIPSPLQVVEGVGNAAGWTQDQLEKIGENSSDTSTETAIVPLAPTQTQVLDQAPSTTTIVTPNATLPPVNVESGSAIVVPNTPAPETASAQTESQIVFVSGSIACSEIETAIFTTQVNVDGETRLDHPVEAMANASGQPMDQIIPTQAEQLWLDTQNILNGGIVEQVEGVTFQSPANCTGFELLSD